MDRLYCQTCFDALFQLKTQPDNPTYKAALEEYDRLTSEYTNLIALAQTRLGQELLNFSKQFFWQQPESDLSDLAQTEKQLRGRFSKISQEFGKC